MNILFLTIGRVDNILDSGIYTDLIRHFRDQGHSVYIVAPVERHMKLPTEMIQDHGVTYLRVKTGNIKKANIIEKGISTILLEQVFASAIKKHINDVNFDLLLYSTPPITFAKVIQKVKRKNNAIAYLMLKDIFPQNAVDLALLSKRNPLYWWFRHKEKQLYKISDYIGCMSKANVHYITRMNAYLDPNIVHISPNTIAVSNDVESMTDREILREQYNIPADRTVFIYGGNLGKPQGINFLIECLKSNVHQQDRYFVICGSGTEYGKLEKFINQDRPQNILLINGLDKMAYDSLVRACDVGMIFLDKRFTIPNFPSRLLGYMDASKPVLAVTDTSSDIKEVIESGTFGCWCESGDLQSFNNKVQLLCDRELAQELGDNGRTFLKNNYTTIHSYNIIMSEISSKISDRQE